VSWRGLSAVVGEGLESGREREEQTADKGEKSKICSKVYLGEN